MKDLNRKFADTESAIQRYVVGRMSNSEAEEFEAYYLGQAELVEQIEVAQKMAAGLNNRLADSEVAAETDVMRSESVIKKLLAWLTVPVPAFAVLAFAAVLSPLALNGLSSVNSPQNIELLDFATATTRSANPSAAEQRVVDLSQVEGQAALMVKVKSVKHPNYKLKLLAVTDGENVWTSEAFQVGALRDHLVLLPENLAGKEYQLEVVGVDPDMTESAVDFCHYSEVCN